MSSKAAAQTIPDVSLTDTCSFARHAVVAAAFLCAPEPEASDWVGGKKCAGLCWRLQELAFYSPRLDKAVVAWREALVLARCKIDRKTFEWCGLPSPSAHHAAAGFGRGVLSAILQNRLTPAEVESYTFAGLKTLEPFHKEAADYLARLREFAEAAEWLIAESEREMAIAQDLQAPTNPPPAPPERTAMSDLVAAVLETAQQIYRESERFLVTIDDPQIIGERRLALEEIGRELDRAAKEASAACRQIDLRHTLENVGDNGCHLVKLTIAWRDSFESRLHGSQDRSDVLEAAVRDVREKREVLQTSMDKLRLLRDNVPRGDPPDYPPSEPAKPGKGERPTTPDSSRPLTPLLSASDLKRLLSERLGCPCGGVDSFLARHRKEAVDCFETVEGRRRTEPKILYRTADVWPVLWEKYSRKK